MASQEGASVSFEQLHFNVGLDAGPIESGLIHDT